MTLRCLSRVGGLHFEAMAGAMAAVPLWLVILSTACLRVFAADDAFPSCVYAPGEPAAATQAELQSATTSTLPDGTASTAASGPLAQKTASTFLSQKP